MRPGRAPRVFILGLIDFTGEVGRYAVARATQRDTAGVEMCHAAVDVLQAEMVSGHGAFPSASLSTCTEEVERR